MAQIIMAIIADDTLDNRNLLNRFLKENLPGSDKIKNVNSSAGETESNDTAGITVEQIKKAARTAKNEHDEDFVKAVLEACGVEVGKSAARALSKLEEDKYATFIELLESGPEDDDEDDDDDDDEDDDELDDDDDDDDDEEEVTGDSVKAKLKAYSKETSVKKAKALMAKFKCASMADVGKLSKARLVKLDAAVDEEL